MKSAPLLALLALLTFDSAVINAAKLPATFKLCKKKDPNLNECLRIAVQEAIRELKTGLPALHVLPMDPMGVTKIAIQDGAGRPVSLNMEFNNVKVTGLSSSEIRALRADMENYTLEAIGILQEASIEADYVMDGRFLVLPLKGKGKCKIDFTGLNATLKLAAEPQTKSGKNYWNVLKFEAHIDSLENLKLKFDNLFNGDEALTENTNKILNENWQQFWEELRPSLEQTLAAVFLQVTNEIFSRVPADDIFLD